MRLLSWVQLGVCAVRFMQFCPPTKQEHRKRIEFHISNRIEYIITTYHHHFINIYLKTKRETHSVEESISPFHLSPQPTTFLLSLLSSIYSHFSSHSETQREREQKKKGSDGCETQCFLFIMNKVLHILFFTEEDGNSAPQ